MERPLPKIRTNPLLAAVALAGYALLVNPVGRLSPDETAAL